MSKMVTFDSRNKIIILKISSGSTKEDHYKAIEKILELCQKNTYTKLLVDLLELDTQQFSLIGCLNFGKTVSKKLHNISIAHVLPNDEKSTFDVQFTSNVEAKNWLLRKK